MKQIFTRLLAMVSAIVLLAAPVSFAQTTCPTPVGLGTTSITANSAQVSWMLPGPIGASYYQVQYRPAGSASWTQVVAQQQTYHLINLNCATVYEWRVQSVCGNSGANTTSPFSVINIFTTLPCGTSCPSPGGLTTTSIGVNNATVSWIGNAGSLTYNLRYRIVSSPNWITLNNVSTPYQLSALACHHGYEWQVQAECTTGTGNTTTSAWSVSANFMTLACPGSCLPPTGLSSTGITSSAATVSWNAVGGAGSYTVRYRPTGTTAWIQTNSTTASKNLLNLFCNTAYEWQVRANCAVASNSQINPFSPSSNFTTLPCPATCNTPSGLTVANITATSAALSWNSVAGAIGYRVQYGVAGTPNFIIVNVPGTTTTLTGLLPSTNYIWQVQTVCGSNSSPILSPWSSLNTFLTHPLSNACATPTGLGTSGVSNQGALLTWNAVTGALSYNIRYKAAGSTTWTNTTSTTNSKQVGGLTPGSVYEFQVQAVCSSLNGAIITSAWSASYVFTTPLLLTIYPNPADHTTTVTFESEIAEKSIIEIRDQIGTIIYSQPVQTIVGRNEISISIGSMKEGLYNLTIQSSYKSQSGRIIIQR